MIEDTDELSEEMQAELRKFTSGKYGNRKGKTMGEVIVQIDSELEEQKAKRSRWTKKE